MTEDPTQKLPYSPSFEERVLAELAAIRGGIAKLDARVTALDARLTALEDKVDARLRETRPIWENVQQQLTELKAQMTAMETRIGAIEKTLDDIRWRITELYGDSIEVRRASAAWRGANASVSASPQVERVLLEARLLYPTTL
jgi:predicted  nucleic acid-binding Zn-ribbon protein